MSKIVEDLPGFERELDKEYSDADLTAEQAGRLCYMSWNRPNPKTAANPDYLLNIQNQKHYSVLSHATVTFYIEGVSRNCTHEWIRSRFFSYSELSQRFWDASESKLSRHPGLEWIGDSERAVVNDALEVAKDAYNVVVENLMDEGGCTRKESRQAARQVLPGGVETKILVSGNLRAWRDFLAQRLSPHADVEIRAVALKIYSILKKEFPGSFQDFDSLGMITTERLVARALRRFREAQMVSCSSSADNMLAFVKEVDKIIKDGLWVLKDDPWEEDKTGSGV